MITMAYEPRSREDFLIDESAFIGRRRELADIKRILARTRLLTLTGPGGVGKSRLARHAAQLLQSRFPDGAEVVDLACLEDEALLEAAVMESLCLRERHHPTGSVLLEHLADKALLLVLDNCEHLLAPCTGLITRLLRETSRLRILATSRQRIGVYGERLLQVPSLTIPCVDDPPRKIARRDAVRLFADRAAAVRPGFAVTTANAPTVARIAQRLDGIPLAIELAAARLRTIPTENLLNELDDRFTTLTGGSSTALPRHQTLRATMDWSHSLCTPEERHLWARLAAFPGGVDLETAEEVCAGGGIDREEIMDLIAGLVDKSVLHSQQHGARTRYVMLDSLREYGRDHLPLSEERMIRGKCCAYYQCLAQANRVDQMVSDQVFRFRRLQAELPNVRVTLDACFTWHDPETGMHIASAMWGYWVMAGTLTEGRHWLDRGLALTSGAFPARLTALWANALLALYQGDITTARAGVEECEVLAKRVGDESALAFALQIAGVAECAAGDAQRGYALLREARRHHHALGDSDAVALNLYLTSVYCSAVAPDEAAVMGEELIALCNERNASLFRAYGQFGVAIATWFQGDWRRTEEMMRKVAIPWVVIDDRWGLAQLLEVMAWTADLRGRHLRAAHLLGAADALWHELHASPSALRYAEEPHRLCVARTRQALGDRAFSTAFRYGTRVGLERAIAIAMEGEPVSAGTLR
jgi:predicted ATPase